MRLTLTRSTAIAPLVALTLLLGACSGGGDDAPADDETTAVADDKGKDDSGKDEPTDEPTDDGEDNGDDLGSSDGAGCLEGSWAGEIDEQLAAVEAIMAESGIEATVVLSGEVVTTFADGTTTSAYDNQVMDIGMAMEGQEIRSVTTMNGTITGTYSATDTTVTMTVTDASGLEMTMETYTGGTLLDGGSTVLDDSTRALMETTSSAPYTCSGDTLTVSLPNAGLGTGVESVMHRR